MISDPVPCMGQCSFLEETVTMINEDLLTIPGIGKSIRDDLVGIGIYRVNDLKGKDPLDLYDKLCKAKGFKIDRCVLYTFRCAVYFASHRKHDPEKLKWWNWKD
jgi:hypothetical protein